MSIKKIIPAVVAVLLCFNLVTNIFLIKNATSLSDKSNKLLTEKQAASYLSISIENLKNIVSKNDSQKNNQGQGSAPYQFIPYIKINNERYYTKQGLDKWVDYNTLANTSY